MRRYSPLTLTTAGVLALAALAAAWQKPPADESPSAYLVTEWPAASDGKPYREHLQDYLNEMAGRGWRFEQDLVSATSARMLVFRRDRDS